MAISTTAAFIDALRVHGVLNPAQLNEIPRTLAHLTDARGLARELIQRGWLTPYQANQVLQGRGAELVLGEYLLVERLGEGGMGQVFKARHQRMDRTVAVKVIRKERLANADAVERFKREIRLAAKLDHPHLIRAFDASQAGEAHFLVMEYAEGTDLQRLIQKSGPLPVAQACEYIRQAALGLQFAAEHGLVHRDIKPSNMQVTAQGKVIKILDMGLARMQAPDGAVPVTELTQNRVILGTADYMAPEQIADSRRVDGRADIYSLGCSLYFLLTGQPPFPEGAWEEKLVNHRKVEPKAVELLRPNVPPGLAAVLRQMMAKRPEDRFDNPAAVAAALAPFCQAGQTVPTAAAPVGTRPQPATQSMAGAPVAAAPVPAPSTAQPAGYERGWTLPVAPLESTAPPGPAAPTASFAGYERGWTLEAEAPPSSPPIPASQVRPAMPPNVAPSPAGPPTVAPVAPAPSGAPKWMVRALAGISALLTVLVLVLLVILITQRGGDPDQKVTDTGGDKGGVLTTHKDTAKDTQKKTPKPESPAVLIEEDTISKAYKAELPIPVKWKSKTNAYALVKDYKNGKPCLRVNEKAGEHFVELPTLPLTDNFSIEGEFEIFFYNVHQTLTIELDSSKGGAKLQVFISSGGGVTISNKQASAASTYKKNEPNTFRVVRKGNWLFVHINGQRVDAATFSELAEFDTVRVSLSVGLAHYAFPDSWAKLYSLKVSSLAP